MNRVIVMGYLGQDPEIKYTPSGVAVTNFSVATTETWTDKNGGGKQESTEWHRIVVWGKQAEHCNQYLTKGRKCLVEGKLQTRSWEGKDGFKRYTTEIRALSVQFVDGLSDRNENTTDNSQQDFMSQKYEVPTSSEFTTDDIPF